MKRFAARSSRLVLRSAMRRRRQRRLAAAPKKSESPLSAKKQVKAPKDALPTEKPSNMPQAEEPPLINPFPLLAHATENIDLSSRLRAFSNNFAIIGALWCTLSISALSMAPLDDVYKDTERIESVVQEPSNNILPAIRWRKATTRAVPPPATRSKNRRRPPVLVKYLGVPEQYLEDIYMACWSASFFTSAIGLGLSTVVAGIVAATAPAYVKIFVRRHSDILMALPLCQGLSSGFAAVGLTVGLDEARGEPVSWIGYIGTIAGAAFVGNSTLKVLKGYKASRAAGKLSVPTSAPKDV